MASGQYLTQLALRLVKEGHQVTVVTSRRAYDDPELRFPKREIWQGIEIYRVASTGFGKTAAWRRAADFASFIVLCTLRLAFLPRHNIVVALTTPPLISVLGAALARLWRARFVYWVMDFNPDEAIAAGWLRADSIPARFLDKLSRFSLRHAHRIIALDDFMRDRILAKEPRSRVSSGRGPQPDFKTTARRISDEKITVIPPWSHDDHVHYDAASRERFRKAHGLEDKFVVMYSGNHSPVHPLATLLAAADRLRNDPGITFCFVGGGSEWRKLKEKAESAIKESDFRIQNRESSIQYPVSTEAHPPSPIQPSTLNSQPSSTTCLPYQPLDQLSGSLSAADLHVVVMGNAMVGLVHPCKIYNILSVGAPILYIGPDRSHVTGILERAGDRQLWGAARHGEVGKVIAHIQRIRALAPKRTGTEFSEIAREFSKERRLPELATAVTAAS